MTKNIFFLIVTVILAVLTLGGLGNAAMQEPFYWVPFVLDIPYFAYIGVKLWRAENPKEGK